MSELAINNAFFAALLAVAGVTIVGATADVAFAFEGTGTLIWNTAEGHFASFQLNGDLTFSADLAIGIEVEGESHSAELYMELGGTYENDVRASE